MTLKKVSPLPWFEKRVTISQPRCPCCVWEHLKVVKGQEPEPTQLLLSPPQCHGEARQGCPVPSLEITQLREKQPLVPQTQPGWLWELSTALDPLELCLGKRQQLRKELLVTGTEQPPGCHWSFRDKPVSPHRPDLTLSAISQAN